MECFDFTIFVIVKNKSNKNRNPKTKTIDFKWKKWKMAPSILGNSSILLADAIIEDKKIGYENALLRKTRQVKK